ncbi:MAG: pyridoxine 5'-phosphate synthase [Balneolaceae bacterium]
MDLLVNIDHIATLRNARGEGYPDPIQAASVCEEAGAAGIVFHLRSDRRHIRDADVYRLKEKVRGRLDFEMAATAEMVKICSQIAPDLATLVPESREELTTEGGLILKPKVCKDLSSRVFPPLKRAGVRISLFLDPNPNDIEQAASIGADAIELHTGTYANAEEGPSRDAELERLKIAAEQAHRLGLQVNAGHGLNLDNLPALVAAVPSITEVSIGHALVSDALFMGLDSTVRAYLKILEIAGNPT